MIFTDNQAVSKICESIITVDNGYQNEYYVYCKGSNCPKWRWYDKEGTPNRRGFCGLAGYPAII